MDEIILEIERTRRLATTLAIYAAVNPEIFSRREDWGASFEELRELARNSAVSSIRLLVSLREELSQRPVGNLLPEAVRQLGDSIDFAQYVDRFALAEERDPFERNRIHSFPGNGLP